MAAQHKWVDQVEPLYRENLDFLTSSSTSAAKSQRTGLGISFKKEFDRIGEIFTNVRKRTLREIQNTQPPVDTLKRVPATVNPAVDPEPLKPKVVPNEE